MSGEEEGGVRPADRLGRGGVEAFGLCGVAGGAVVVAGDGQVAGPAGGCRRGPPAGPAGWRARRISGLSVRRVFLRRVEGGDVDLEGARRRSVLADEPLQLLRLRGGVALVERRQGGGVRQFGEDRQGLCLGGWVRILP